MSDKLRWGIIGTGMIANTFATALAKTKHGVKQAVGSRTKEKAQAFAQKHGFPASYGSYEALLADKDVDAVYISTPHPLHFEPTMAAIRAGKPVLCEKPLGVTVAECREMVAAAETKGVVLLEAFMYRCHPQTLRVAQLLREKALGTVRTVRSCFTYGLGDAYNVRLDKSLRGGGLYDVGCYCINFSRMATGEEPKAIKAVATIGPKTGVDENLAVVLEFPSGTLAHFDVGVRSFGSSYGEIVGTDGRIYVPPSPWKPDATRAAFTLALKGRPVQEVVTENGGDAYALEADHLADVVAGRATPLIPAANAIGNAAVLETIWNGLRP